MMRKTGRRVIFRAGMTAKQVHPLRETTSFCKRNGRLLFLVALLLIGAGLGTCIYAALDPHQQLLLAQIFTKTKAPVDFADGCLMTVSSAFGGFVLLAILFLLGLTAFGTPLTLLVPLFFGFGIGVNECASYAAAGLYAVAVTVLPHQLIAAAGLLTASAEAMRMSASLSRQLLPMSAHCGGMWQDFKLYLLRFLLCMLIVYAAAVADVLLRCL